MWKGWTAVAALGLALSFAAVGAIAPVAHAQGGQVGVQAAAQEVPKVPAGDVKTANGVVSGTLGADGRIRIYRGIPFAQPPVGDWRWREPQPPKNWTGVRDGSEFAARCMQTLVLRTSCFATKATAKIACT